MLFLFIYLLGNILHCNHRHLGSHSLNYMNVHRYTFFPMSTSDLWEIRSAYIEIDELTIYRCLMVNCYIACYRKNISRKYKNLYMFWVVDSTRVDKSFHHHKPNQLNYANFAHVVLTKLVKENYLASAGVIFRENMWWKSHMKWKLEKYR